MGIPTLYQFFRHQVQHGFHHHGLSQAATVDYVSDILARFAQTRALYGVQDSAGKPLEYIVDMLEAWRQAQGGDGGSSSPSRERFVSLHLGEYTLFMSGLFRERLKTRGQLDYYMAHGSSAFWRCAGYMWSLSSNSWYFRLSRIFFR